MEKKGYTEEQIGYALKQVESGVSIKEQCRKMGVSTASFYTCKEKYTGFGIAELRRLKSFEDESRKLKQLVADLSLDKHVLQDLVTKKL